MDKLTLSVPEAAKALGISHTKAYAEAAAGHLPTIKFGKRILVSRAGLERMISEVKPQAQANQEPHNG